MHVLSRSIPLSAIVNLLVSDNRKCFGSQVAEYLHSRSHRSVKFTNSDHRGLRFFIDRTIRSDPLFPGSSSSRPAKMIKKHWPSNRAASLKLAGHVTSSSRYKEAVKRFQTNYCKFN